MEKNQRYACFNCRAVVQLILLHFYLCLLQVPFSYHLFPFLYSCLLLFVIIIYYNYYFIIMSIFIIIHVYSQSLPVWCSEIGQVLVQPSFRVMYGWLAVWWRAEASVSVGYDTGLLWWSRIKRWCDADVMRFENWRLLYLLMYHWWWLVFV